MKKESHNREIPQSSRDLRFEWAVAAQLARMHRPGYYFANNHNIPVSEVEEWIRKVKTEGIISIICLLSDEQLNFYRSLPEGLLNYYRKSGFHVKHIPVTDYKSPPLSASELEKVWEAYEDFDKPVLVHCSAGMDRTGAAIEHILRKLN
jgi:protein-tyrosine phosphatase